MGVVFLMDDFIFKTLGLPQKRVRLKHCILLPKLKSRNTRGCHLTFAKKKLARLFLLSVLGPVYMEKIVPATRDYFTCRDPSILLKSLYFLPCVYMRIYIIPAR